MNKPEPLVSVIALCFNQEEFLAETLDSVKRQTYKNIEFIIIDDYSLISQLKNRILIKANQHNCKFIKNKENLGLVNH